jgi:hypothetical protein
VAVQIHLLIIDWTTSPAFTSSRSAKRLKQAGNAVHACHLSLSHVSSL